MKRNRAQRELDLDKLLELDAQGKSQNEIAIALNISQCQVSKDLSALDERAKKAHGSWDTNKYRELAKIRYVEREAHAAWQRSKQELTSTSTKKVTGEGEGRTRNEARVDKEQRDGNPAYLATVLDCIRERINLVRPAQKRLTLDTLGELLDALPYDVAFELRAILGGAHRLPGLPQSPETGASQPPSA